MPRIDFDAMPASARLWIFSAGRELGGPERDRLLEQVDAFLDSWAAHGVPLSAARDWRYDRFLFISVDEEAAGASGCSIDSLVRGIRGLETEMGTTLVDHSPVLFRDGEEIRRATRKEFAELAEAGTVTLETSVFNNTLTTVGQVRSGEWEVSAADSWHARAFF